MLSTSSTESIPKPGESTGNATAPLEGTVAFEACVVVSGKVHVTVERSALDVDTVARERALMAIRSTWDEATIAFARALRSELRGRRVDFTVVAKLAGGEPIHLLTHEDSDE